LKKIAEIHYPSSIRVIEEQKLRLELLQSAGKGEKRQSKVRNGKG